MRLKRLSTLVVLTLLAPLASRAADSPTTRKSDSNPAWQDILDKSGDLTKATSDKVTITPRTARWRLALSTSRSDSSAVGKPNISAVKLSVLIEDRDKVGHTIWRSIDVSSFKGHAGDATQFSFSNALWPDGSPRDFQISVDGMYVKYELEVQDQGDKPLDSSDSGKKKEKAK